MANSSICFDTLTKYSPMNSEKYTLLSILIKEFENRFQDCRKNSQFSGIFVTSFSADINTLPANFYIECIDLQSFNSNIWLCFFVFYKIFFMKTFIRSLLPEKNIPRFTITPYLCHLFLAVCTFVNNYFQSWNTGIVKFHQKSLMNTLRTC